MCLRTLPSKFQGLDEQHNETISPGPIAVPPVRTSALSPAYSTLPSARPALRHTTSSSANLEPTTSSNRLRSGSLTLLPNGLSHAFGSSPFSNTWLANPGLTTSQSRSPLGNTDVDPIAFSYPVDQATTRATEKLNFSTLDHLGLAEGLQGQLPPASLSELRSQHQRAIANSGPASRLRASTVSNVARSFRPSVTSATPYSRDHNPRNDRREEEALTQAIEDLGMYDSEVAFKSPLASLYAPSSLFNKESNRPRATTIGAFDHPQRRANTRHLDAIPQSPDVANLANPMMGGPYGYPPRSRSDRDFTRSRDSSVTRGPRPSISSHPSRTATPDFAGSSTPQMPTRSLWIGNLDVNATSDALLYIFAPYGAIESVRMLPEKVNSHFPIAESK